MILIEKKNPGFDIVPIPVSTFIGGYYHFQSKLYLLAPYWIDFRPTQEK